MDSSQQNNQQYLDTASIAFTLKKTKQCKTRIILWKEGKDRGSVISTLHSSSGYWHDKCFRWSSRWCGDGDGDGDGDSHVCYMVMTGQTKRFLSRPQFLTIPYSSHWCRGMVLSFISTISSTSTLMSMHNDSNWTILGMRSIKHPFVQSLNPYPTWISLFSFTLCSGWYLYAALSFIVYVARISYRIPIVLMFKGSRSSLK